MLVVQPAVHTGKLAEIRNCRIGGIPENVQTDGKQDHVNQTRNQDPLPQPVFANKFVRLSIGLYGNDNLF